MPERLERRRFLLLAAGTTAAALVTLPAGPARATPEEVAALIKEVVGNAVPVPGKLKLDLPLMVENGNSVGVTVGVFGRLDPDERIESIHIFAEANPLPNVATFHFGPRSGKPLVATRMRLATSQTVTAIAKLADGSCWTDSVELMVTLAACLE